MYLVTLVIVGEELRHSVDLCEYLNKKLGAFYQKRDINVVQRGTQEMNSKLERVEEIALMPVDIELKVPTICGLVRASSLFFRASKWTHFSE